MFSPSIWLTYNKMPGAPSEFVIDWPVNSLLIITYSHHLMFWTIQKQSAATLFTLCSLHWAWIQLLPPPRTKKQEVCHNLQKFLWVILRFSETVWLLAEDFNTKIFFTFFVLYIIMGKERCTERVFIIDKHLKDIVFGLLLRQRFKQCWECPISHVRWPWTDPLACVMQSISNHVLCLFRLSALSPFGILLRNWDQKGAWCMHMFVYTHIY